MAHTPRIQIRPLDVFINTHSAFERRSTMITARFNSPEKRTKYKSWRQEFQCWLAAVPRVQAYLTYTHSGLPSQVKIDQRNNRKSVATGPSGNAETRRNFISASTGDFFRFLAQHAQIEVQTGFSLLGTRSSMAQLKQQLVKTRKEERTTASIFR